MLPKLLPIRVWEAARKRTGRLRKFQSGTSDRFDLNVEKYTSIECYRNFDEIDP
jgi:hypothetical protein